MSDDLRAEVDALLARVRQLEDREEIARVIWNYSFLLDTGQWNEVPAAVYSEDGMDVHSEDTDPPMITEGRTAMRDFFRYTMPHFDGTQHFTGPSMIDLDGDTAKARTYLFASHWMKTGKGTGPVRPADCIMALAYDDELVRTAAGWRVSKRRLHAFGPGSSLAVGFMPDFCMPAVGGNLYGAPRQADEEADRT
ncbi:MAG: nuclear transport factor 2 family protein [Actinobacteria bacterium]|nr:nuclear transport factor 2 family protein [Actinomycetota bacterium]